MQIKKLLLPILATVMLICGCQQNNAVSGQDQLVTASENKTTYTAQNIPEYTGSPYVELNNNIPDFQESEYTTEVFEQYSDLLKYSRHPIYEEQLPFYLLRMYLHQGPFFQQNMFFV